jgi:hypothetical protein
MVLTKALHCLHQDQAFLAMIQVLIPDKGHVSGNSWHKPDQEEEAYVSPPEAQHHVRH